MTTLNALQKISQAGPSARVLRRLTLTLLPSLIVLSILATPAQAVTEGTGWHAFSSVYPTNLPPGGDGTIQLDIINTGAKPSQGPITVTDTLPAGVSATKAGGMEFGAQSVGTEPLSPQEEEAQKKGAAPGGARWVCTGNGSGERNVDGATVITCTSNPAFLPTDTAW